MRAIRKCDCWPPELPFLDHYSSNDHELSNLSSIVLCHWRKLATLPDFKSERNINESAEFHDVFNYCAGSESEKECVDICKLDCVYVASIQLLVRIGQVFFAAYIVTQYKYWNGHGLRKRESV